MDQLLTPKVVISRCTCLDTYKRILHGFGPIMGRYLEVISGPIMVHRWTNYTVIDRDSDPKRVSEGGPEWVGNGSRSGPQKVVI